MERERLMEGRYTIAMMKLKIHIKKLLKYWVKHSNVSMLMARYQRSDLEIQQPKIVKSFHSR